MRGEPIRREGRARRGGRRRVRVVIEPLAVDRRLAQRNLIGGFVAAGIALLMFGLVFFVTVLYIG
jgi:hypothetical protein